MRGQKRSAIVAPSAKPFGKEQTMLHIPNTLQTRQMIVDQVRAIASRFAQRAEAAEQARKIPAESVQDMLAAGLARILVPTRFGGCGLDFDTWFDVALEIGKADASHGWCASLIIHHGHLIGQFPEEAQQAVWADGSDVAVAASLAPTTKVTTVDGGYRVSGQHSSFASGVDHSSWVIVGGLVHKEAVPEWMLFLAPPGEYTVRDTWSVAGMRATGSNTIVTDDVFVPSNRTLRLSDLRDGTGPGGALHDDPIFHTPFFYFAPLTFAAPMLGAAKGAYEHVREWTKTRKATDGTSVAEKTSIQVRMARAAADLDAAELLLRRTVEVPNDPDSQAPHVLARSVRDFARASELVVAAIDLIISMCGTAGFVTTHPVQRAWRDIHLASMHMSLNTETNYSHFGRMELGLARDPNQPFF
jgi:3-hydroxy-9,10-secoandrosta-1,3,5(10)-triene-9,17-dione monooxygenase